MTMPLEEMYMPDIIISLHRCTCQADDMMTMTRYFISGQL